MLVVGRAAPPADGSLPPWLAVAVRRRAGRPTAYALDTAATAHTGSIPTAGPSSGTGFGRMGGPGGQPGGGGFPGGAGFPGAAPDGAGTGTGTGAVATSAGCSTAARSTTAIDELLLADADAYTWVAATVGANSAAGYQLATGESVMPIGGFNGSDPSPTLAQFQAYVAAGEIHYFISGGGGLGGRGGPGTDDATTSEIATWVADNFTAQTVDGVTLYDLG